MKTIKIIAPYIMGLALIGAMALSNCFGLANNKVYKPSVIGITIDDSVKHLNKPVARLMRDDTND